MNSTEMMERFRRFVSADLSHATPNRMQQISEVLLENSAIRIILTRYMHKTNDIEVDIEVSLPSLLDASNAISLQESIDNVIAALDYLKRLISIGFNLKVFREEGMLIASSVLSEDTEEHVFKILEPPE